MIEIMWIGMVTLLLVASLILEPFTRDSDPERSQLTGSPGNPAPPGTT